MKFKIGDILESSGNDAFLYRVQNIEDNQYKLMAICKQTGNENEVADILSIERIEEICSLEKSNIFNKELKDLLDNT